jgi:hypothetical protein
MSTNCTPQLKDYRFARCPRHYYCSLRPPTEIWIASMARDSDKVTDHGLQHACDHLFEACSRRMKLEFKFVFLRDEENCVCLPTV